MPRLLARLRDDLDFLPSPMADRPGLLIRDPFRYTDAALVMPPALVPCLRCFDGTQTDLDLQALVGTLTKRADLAETCEELARGLSEAGFLDDEFFASLRAKQRATFARAAIRRAAFAGGGYPDDPPKLRRTIEHWLGGRSASDGARSATEPPPPPPSLGIAAPHVSPSGGVTSYGAAYGALSNDLADRTFVILGTSHYGEPNRFGLTRKGFQTPMGQAVTDAALVDRLERAAPEAVEVEDYCHSVEHSIEFQVLFLQARFGPSVRILPVLCGPFVTATHHYRTGAPVPLPERDARVARLLDALGDLQATEGARLFWVLGIDMAHVGRRYGDDVDARAHDGVLLDVAARDRARLDRALSGDAAGFWAALHERGQDDLKWCGSSPLYAFLRANPGGRGRLLDYDQWNIDAQSVVSFAALAFDR